MKTSWNVFEHKLLAERFNWCTFFVDCEDIIRTLSDAFFFWLGVSGFDSKTHDVTSVISYWYLCSSHFVMWVQPDALLSPYLLWVWLKLVLVTWLQVLEKKFNFQKTENLGGKHKQIQCFSLKFLYSQLFCFLLAAFWVEQLMAKNQEILVFYLAFSFTAEKRILMELWLQWLNTDFFRKETEGRASLASHVKLLKTSMNSISEAQSLSKLFSVDTTQFFHHRLVYSRIDVVHRSFVVLYFGQSVTICSILFIQDLMSRYNVYLGLCGDI